MTNHLGCDIISNVVGNGNELGGLAQLGEHLPYKQRVTGSSPVVSTKKEVTFVYQKLLLFLSKPQAWYIITARSAVHIISPAGCISSRFSVYLPAA